MLIFAILTLFTMFSWSEALTVTPEVLATLGMEDLLMVGSNLDTIIQLKSNMIKTAEDNSLNLADLPQLTNPDAGFGLEKVERVFTTMDCFDESQTCLFGTSNRVIYMVDISSTNLQTRIEFIFDNSTIGGRTRPLKESLSVFHIETFGKNSNYFVAGLDMKGILRWDKTDSSHYVQYIFEQHDFRLTAMKFLKNSKHLAYKHSLEDRVVYFLDVTNMQNLREFNTTDQLSIKKGGGFFIDQIEIPERNLVIATRLEIATILDYSGGVTQLDTVRCQEAIDGMAVFEQGNAFVTLHTKDQKLRFHVVTDGSGSVEGDPVIGTYDMTEPKAIFYSRLKGNMVVLTNSGNLVLIKVTVEVGKGNPLCGSAPSPTLSFTNYNCQSCSAPAVKIGDYCDAQSVLLNDGNGDMSDDSLLGNAVKARGWALDLSEYSDALRMSGILSSFCVLLLFLVLINKQ